jgi:hypothetical protein
METKKFKNLIKEALSDDLVVVQSQCEDTEGINVCDLLSKEKSQKLIDTGEIMRDIMDRRFTPEDVDYLTNVISVAKREYGENDEEVLNLEKAVKDLMDISGDIRSAKPKDITLESLKEDFRKFKLS